MLGGQPTGRGWLYKDMMDNKQESTIAGIFATKKLEIIWESFYHVARNKGRLQGYDGQETGEYNC